MKLCVSTDREYPRRIIKYYVLENFFGIRESEGFVESSVPFLYECYSQFYAYPWSTSNHTL